MISATAWRDQSRLQSHVYRQAHIRLEEAVMSYTDVLVFVMRETRPARATDRESARRNASARRKIERLRDQQRLRVDVTEVW